MPRATSSRKILIADDAENIRTGLARLFSKNFSVVDTAQDGYEALNKVSIQEYDIILLDQNMPNCSGTDFLQSFSPAIRGKTIVVFLTAETDINVQKTYLAGATAVLNKPIYPTDLSDIVIKFCTDRDAYLEMVREKTIMEARYQQIESASGIDSLEVVHDLNNFFHLIKMHMQRIKFFHLKNPPQTKCEKTIAKIEKSYLKIDSLIDRSASTYKTLIPKPPSEANQIQKHSSSLCSILKEVSLTFEDIFDLSQISFSLDGCEGLFIEAKMDLVFRIIFNLLKNSVEAINKLETKWIKMEVVKHDEQTVQIAITDSGSGISPEQGKKILSSHYTDKEQSEMSGLGLGFVLRSLKEINGELQIDYENQNTCFTLHLPLFTQ
jgi:CheY-like chemotaxis protein